MAQHMPLPTSEWSGVVLTEWTAVVFMSEVHRVCGAKLTSALIQFANGVEIDPVSEANLVRFALGKGAGVLTAQPLGFVDPRVQRDVAKLWIADDSIHARL